MKFSQGHSMLKDIQDFMVGMSLKDKFQFGLLNSRHVILNFCCEDDFDRMYSRMIWYVDKHAMRVFKWTTDFHIDKEPSIIPVQIEFEKLLTFLFNGDVLFAIVSLVGQSLRMDTTTAVIRKPNVARVQVEVVLI